MKLAHSLLAALLLGATPLLAADPPAAAPSPGEIVAAAPAADWVRIAPADLLALDLAPDARGRARRVVIELMPAPFSQGWVGNVRRLALAHWWDGLSVYRVQDNYVAQWGDAEGEDKAKARALPGGLAKMQESEYELTFGYCRSGQDCIPEPSNFVVRRGLPMVSQIVMKPDAYGTSVGFADGWPLSLVGGVSLTVAPVHCYGMVGVARDMSPDTGTGAELYTVIGHAPRQLDRNIALVGRVIEGIEHLSSLPRGPAPMGVYTDPAERTPIRTVRLGTEAADLPAYEYLSTESASFARYADARANRRDPFFIVPAGGADICNIPVPVRRVKG